MTDKRHTPTEQDHTSDSSPAIGPFRILREIGEGGMGIIYDAEQMTPVRRRVALKVVKVDITSKQALARFDAERQALAVMDHPNIAKILDAGVTSDGRPYFAMELVHGVPLTNYCDAGQLPIRERLRLFLEICKGVQHAHQKGVIHRDLKPSNVLVGDQDGRPVPKIIDFGIAKAMGRRLTDRTIVTEYGAAIGTLAYMSPEQAERSGLDVDTRSDIYSLGVMLHELATGTLPVDPESMTPVEFIAQLVTRDAVQRPPSSLLASTNVTLIARNRRTSPQQIRREIAGDLDWIILRALEKDRNRRFQTAQDLANDVERYLDNRPVLSGPPHLAYRIKKFIRRNRAAVVTACLIALITLVGFGATLAALGRARRAEAVAEQEVRVSLQVMDFLVGLFAASGPGEPVSDLTATEILDRGARTLRSALADQPLIRAPMLHAIGRAYELAGRYEESEELLTEALALRERELGPSNETVARSLNTLGNILRIRGKYAEAESALTRADNIFSVTSPTDRERGDLANNFGALYLEVGRLSRAESLLTRAIRYYENSPNADTVLANPLSNLGTLYISKGQWAEAESTLVRALSLRRDRLPPNHPMIADVLNNLGVVFWFQEDYAQAEPYYRQTLEIYEETLGPDHLYTGSALNNLGETYWAMGDLDRAEPLLRRALATKNHAVGDDHPANASTLKALANVLRDRGSYGEAEPHYQRALMIREKQFGLNSSDLIGVLRDYADMLRRSNQINRARQLEERISAIEAN